MLSGQPDIAPPPAAAAAAAGAAGLDARLDALGQGQGCGEDFDRASWLWLVLLGLVMPALMLVAGWWLG